MQQAKDPSKTHRLTTLLKAQLGISHLYQSKTISTAERAALELHSRPLEKLKQPRKKSFSYYLSSAAAKYWTGRKLCIILIAH